MVSLDPSPPYELQQTLCTNLGLKYLLVIDFETTCENINPADYIHEIIEFPSHLLDLSSLKIVSFFMYTCKVLKFLRLFKCDSG